MQVLLHGVSLRDNLADLGGALSTWGNASLTAANGCIIANNIAFGGAGVVLNDNSSTTLLGATLANNTAQNAGAGVYAGSLAQVCCTDLALLIR